MKESTQEQKIENLILKAKGLGIIFVNGPATYETIHDKRIVHVLEDMTDDTFYDTLLQRVELYESKKFLSVLQKHSLLTDNKTELSDELVSNNDALSSK